MTMLVLVRHATTGSTGTRLGGRTETPLDAGGRAQAAAAAQRLRGMRFGAIYASPLARTLETARIVAEPHGIEVRAEPGLLEVEYGRWTDRPLKPLMRTKLWPVIQTRPSLVEFPGGETIRSMQQRAVDAIEQIVARHPRGVVAAVTHADVIKAVVAFYLGQPLDLFQRLVVNPASASVLALSPNGRPALLRFNDDGPLEAPSSSGRSPTRAKAAKRG